MTSRLFKLPNWARMVIKEKSRFTARQRSQGLNMTNSYVAQLLAKLEEKGIMEKEKNKDTRRAIYKLTPKGKELKKSLNEIEDLLR